MGSESQAPKLPVLDFTKGNLKPGTESWLSACKNVRKALEEYGCFIVENKMKNRYEKPLNGYVGQIPKLPLHESMGIDNATSLEGTQYFTNLMWPEGTAISAAEIDQMVSRMIFESYGVEKYHDAYIGSTTYLLRLLKNRVPKEGEPNLAFVTRTDKSFANILHQNQIDGLEAWGNDRVLSPSPQVIMRGNVDRYSLGLFAFNDGIIEVPKELVDEEHPLRY
ncbi:hypothetical protein SLEP1_g43995 [Rubroshorea leprosula]|uniref:Non-haem dioxygenase N-terminal domain-containing protein n=1 Tax=Rubroshorea leprosula TaxID=152421 RepID=A0AAV5LFB4_9ROSI|nr:hypothetical protein SLEP1_g43995 [Rubroshorea leprosula]